VLLRGGGGPALGRGRLQGRDDLHGPGRRSGGEVKGAATRLVPQYLPPDLRPVRLPAQVGFAVGPARIRRAHDHRAAVPGPPFPPLPAHALLELTQGLPQEVSLEVRTLLVGRRLPERRAVHGDEPRDLRQHPLPLLPGKPRPPQASARPVVPVPHRPRRYAWPWAGNSWPLSRRASSKVSSGRRCRPHFPAGVLTQLRSARSDTPSSLARARRAESRTPGSRPSSTPDSSLRAAAAFDHNT